MTEAKREVLDMRDSNIAKLNVTKGENLAELYVQNNRIEEMDLSNNVNLEILECEGNPLKSIKAIAPDGFKRFPLELEAGKGGSISLKLAPGVQQYKAVPDENYEFEGWYNELGDRISREAVWDDVHGSSRVIVAWFREK